MSARTEHWTQVVGIAAGAFLVLAAIFGWTQPADAASNTWSATMTAWTPGQITIEEGDMTCPGNDAYSVEVISDDLGGFCVHDGATPGDCDGSQVQEFGGFPVVYEAGETELPAWWVEQTTLLCTVEEPCQLAVTMHCNDSTEDLVMGISDDDLVVANISLSPAIPIWYAESLLNPASAVWGSFIEIVIPTAFILLGTLLGIHLIIGWFVKIGRR